MATHRTGAVNEVADALLSIAQQHGAATLTPTHIRKRMNRAAQAAGYADGSEMIHDIIRDVRPYTKGVEAPVAQQPAAHSISGDTIEVNGVIYQRVS